MPTARHRPALHKITRQLDTLIQADGRDLEYIGLGFLAACYEFKASTRLTWRWMRGFWQACEFIEYKGEITRTALFDYMELRYNKMDGLPEQVAPFFLFDPASRRYALSPAGEAARQQWGTILRCVLQDERERYRLLYDRWNKEEIARRRKLKRFFELATDEQIRIARAFFAMPRTTPEQREHVQSARKYLYLNFDVRPNDLKLLAKQYPVISAVRNMPPGHVQDTPADLDTIFRRPEHYRKASDGQSHSNILPDDFSK